MASITDVTPAGSPSVNGKSPIIQNGKPAPRRNSGGGGIWGAVTGFFNNPIRDVIGINRAVDQAVVTGAKDVYGFDKRVAGDVVSGAERYGGDVVRGAERYGGDVIKFEENAYGISTAQNTDARKAKPIRRTGTTTAKPQVEAYSTQLDNGKAAGEVMKQVQPAAAVKKPMPASVPVSKATVIDSYNRPETTSNVQYDYAAATGGGAATSDTTGTASGSTGGILGGLTFGKIAIGAGAGFFVWYQFIRKPKKD